MASIAASDTATLRLREKNQSPLTHTAFDDGMNASSPMESGCAVEGAPSAVPRRILEISLRVAIVISLGSGDKVLTLSSTNLINNIH